MSLEVIVSSATNLPNLESMGKIDPYVSVEYQGVLLCYVSVARRHLRPIPGQTTNSSFSAYRTVMLIFVFTNIAICYRVTSYTLLPQTRKIYLFYCLPSTDARRRH